ncbi:MAG: sulfatase family protein [Pseudomonadales bacterium]
MRQYHLESVLILVCALCLSAQAVERPDMVVFITDDQSQADASLYGNIEVRTPKLESLAREGMTFSHAFVASPACAPSRAALLTGLMPARNGAEANHTDPRDSIKKLPAYFHELGYEVVAFGKVAHQNTEIYGFDQAASEGWIWKGGIGYAVEYLQARPSDKPLLMFVGTFEPHEPWPDIDGYSPETLSLPDFHVNTAETRAARAQYYTAITEADRKLAVVHELAQQKLNNPLFIFTSDHGGQWPFGKWSLYDYGIRVPFVASWPGVIEPGSQSDAMISWVDLLPTLLELVGGEIPTDIDGRSFAKVLTEGEAVHRDRIFTTHSGDGGTKINAYPIRSVRERNWKYIFNLYPELPYHTHIDRGPGAVYWASWDAAAKTDNKAAALLQRYHQRPAEELYDLENDPHEQYNLASDPAHAERLAAMRAELENWMAEQGDRRKLYENAEGPWFLKLINWLLY